MTNTSKSSTMAAWEKSLNAAAAARKESPAPTHVAKDIGVFVVLFGLPVAFIVLVHPASGWQARLTGLAIIVAFVLLRQFWARIIRSIPDRVWRAGRAFGLAASAAGRAASVAGGFAAYLAKRVAIILAVAVAAVVGLILVLNAIEHRNAPVCQYRVVPQGDGTAKLYNC